MCYKGNCRANAITESFFGSLKTEWTCDKKYGTREKAKLDVFKYIEVFYDRKRRHASLGFSARRSMKNSMSQGCPRLHRSMLPVAVVY